jgi:hypothetical protein
MSERVALAVMARAPSDGRGKTRLLKALGVDDGTELRRAILLDTLDVVQRVSGAEHVLVFAPESARAEIARLAGREFRLLAQRGGDLGERLDHAFEDLFALGYSAVTIIGSDLPTLPAEQVKMGIDALRLGGDPLVLGPALDGGYYLIGLRMNHPEIFQAIPWSTGRVLAATLSAAEARRLSVTLIPPWYDVDSVDDLRRILEPSTGGALRPRRVHAWVTARFRRD